MLAIYFAYSGNTRVVAEKLQARTGADLHRVETVRSYPVEYRALTDEAKREQEQNDPPQIKNPTPDMPVYDLILVDGPVWWCTAPTPLMRFLRQADFAGKKTAAFRTHAGGVGQYFPHFKEQAKTLWCWKAFPCGAATRGTRPRTRPWTSGWLNCARGLFLISCRSHSRMQAGLRPACILEWLRQKEFANGPGAVPLSFTQPTFPL